MPLASPLSPVQVDGHTRAAALSKRTGDGWHVARSVWERWWDEDYAREHRKRGGALVQFGDVRGLMRCGGYKHRTVHLEVPRRAHIIADLGTGGLRFQLHAPELWSRGASCFGEWTDRVVHHFGATDVRVTGVELCRDFTMEKPFDVSDAPNFTGQFKRRPWTGPTGELETLDLGKRSSPESLCIYLKTVQLSQVKKAELATYTPTWEANGWDGVSPVWRLECRLARRGLDVEEVDLRSPTSWHAQSTADEAWSGVCSRHRLLKPSTAERKNWRTDERWHDVTDVGACGLTRIKKPVDLERARERALSLALRNIARALEIEGHPTPWEAAAEMVRTRADLRHSRRGASGESERPCQTDAPPA